MQDVRLDYINKLSPAVINQMTIVRQAFIELDKVLQEPSVCEVFLESGAARTTALARTHLEAACMYAIKSLCLVGEVKE